MTFLMNDLRWPAIAGLVKGLTIRIARGVDRPVPADASDHADSDYARPARLAGSSTDSKAEAITRTPVATLHTDVRELRRPAQPHRPGIALDSLDLDKVQVRATSLVGEDHQYRATPRQDSYAIALSSDASLLAVAVADGLGSSEDSDLGSKAAAEALVDMLVRPGPEFDLQANSASVEGYLLPRLCEAITDLGRVHLADSYSPERVLTTLLGVLVYESTDGIQMLAVQNGTSDVLLTLQSAGWGRAGSPLVPATSSLETLSLAPLPLQDARLSILRIPVPPGSAIALFTDGLADPLLSPDGQVSQHLQREWTDGAPYIGDFLGHVSFVRRGDGDDRTAVVLWFPAQLEGRSWSQAFSVDSSVPPTAASETDDLHGHVAITLETDSKAHR